VIANGLLVAGLVLLAGWVVGVSGAFDATANWTLFLAGSALAVASRAFAR
jgi:hypothetical protein